MAKTRKYFRKHRKTHKKHKKCYKTHKRHRKSLMRRNKKLHKKSRKYRAKGGGNFPYLPQGLVNTMWNTQHGAHKLINDYSGRPSPPGIYPTQQPDLLHYERPPVSVPNLNALSETADLSVAGLLNN
jgi:hypothetical protein